MSQVWAVRCPPAHTSSSRWRGGIGPACKVLLGHNLGRIQHRSCVALPLPGQTVAPGHMTRLERGVRGYSGISRGVSGLVTRIHTAGKDSIHLGGPGCATWETHVADTHTHTWREKGVCLKFRTRVTSYQIWLTHFGFIQHTVCLN